MKKLDDNNVSLIITNVLNRVMTIPFPEKSEEVRLNIVKLLGTVVEQYPICFHASMSETSSALAKL